MKIQITRTQVCEIEYTEKRGEGLEKGYYYTVILIQGFGEDGSQVQIHFLNTAKKLQIFDDFVEFSKHWKIIKEIEFKEAYLPIKGK